MTRSAVALARLASPFALPATDAELLRAFLASRAEDSFAEVVRRHGPMVLAVCRRVLSDRHDAEDAFQAVFLVLARKAGAIRGTNLAGWLYGVAVRTARGVRIMRDRRRKRELASGGRIPAKCEALPDHDTAQIIDDELAKLPEHYRDALVVCELRGLSRKEAARELGVPEGTLSSRLAGAKKKLAERLGMRGLAGAVVLAATLPPAAVSAALEEAAALAVRGSASSVASAAASAVLKGMLFDQLKAVVLAAGLLLTGVCGGFAMTGAPDTQPAQNPPVTQPRATSDPAATLVKQLGSEDFAEREAAWEKLRELGPKAEAALKAALKSDEPEVRDRAAKLLTAIRKDALDALVKNFDPKAEAVPDHPIWRRFKVIAGDTKASRELFARIIKNAEWLRRLDAAEAGPDAAAKQYGEAILDVGRHYRANMSVFFFIPVWPCDTADQAGYLLFLGSYAGTDSARPTKEAEAHLFSDGESRIYYARGLMLGILGKEIAPGPAKEYNETALLAPGTDRVFGRLLAAWLPRRTDPHARQNGFRVAVEGGAAEVLLFARKLAADRLPRDRELPMRVRVAALAAVARFGTHADLPLFAALFEDESVLSPFTRSGANPAGTDGAGVVQVRDCAYGLALLLHGEDPVNHGFLLAGRKSPKPGGRPDVALYSDIDFGFLNGDDQARAAAHAKAKAFLAKQKEKPKEQPKSDPAAAQLVEKLGSADFPEREAAAKELRKMGARAEAALRAGLKSENPEVRDRCAKVLAGIRKDALDTLVLNFDPTADDDPDHPLWRRYEAVAGGDRNSRWMFAAILADSRLTRLLDAAEANPADRARLYREEVARQSLNAVYDVADHMPGGYRLLQGGPKANSLKPPPEPITAEVLAAYFFLGSYPETAVEVNGKDRAGRAIREGLIVEAWAFDKSTPDRGVIRKLFAAWLDNRVNRDTLESAYWRATSNDIPEAADAARRLLAAKKLPAEAKAYAAIYLARVGKKKDTALIAPLLDDATVARKIEYDGKPAPVQVRDAALAASLLLHGENPADYGFDILRKRESRKADAYDVAWLGFWTDESRAATHKKAKEWLDNQQK